MMDSRDAEAARLILRERGVSAGERDLQSLRIVSSRVQIGSDVVSLSQSAVSCAACTPPKRSGSSTAAAAPCW